MTDYTSHYDSGEQPASYTAGIVDPDQSAGNKCEENLNTCQPDSVPPGLERLHQDRPAPAVPTPQPAAVQPEANEPNPKLDYALRYAGIGWPVIPCTWIWEHAGEKHCSCNKPDCDSPGKHPIWKLAPHGLKDATTDPETIRKWWGEYPAANIAVVTGETSGIVAVDIDTHKGGQAVFDQWVFENNIQLPETATQQTGSGGLHYVFRYPAGIVVGNRTDMLKGVDVRGQNGYIMVEPSHNMGGPYGWIDGDPWESEIAELPPKLLELIGGKQKSESGAAPGVAGAKWIIPEDTIQEIIDALRFIPADLYQRGTDPRTGKEILGWIEIGHAIKAMGLGERGFQIWDEWSQKSSKYDPKVMRSKWNSFGPTEITHLSIFKCAQDLGWINPQSRAAGGGADASNIDRETGEVLEPGDVFEVMESSSDEDRALAYEVRELLKSITPESNIPNGKHMASEIVGWGVFDKLGSKNIALGLAVCGEWDERHKAEIQEMQGISSVDAYHIARNTKTGSRIGYGSLVMLAKESPVAYVDDCDDEGETIEDIEDEKIFPEIPPNLLTIPGVLGYAVDWINATSRKPQPALAVQAVLCFGSTVLGRRYKSDDDNWPSLYYLNVADSGSGKEKGKTSIEEMLEASEQENLIGPARYTCESAVLSTLVQKPCHVTVIDEFGKALKAATNPKNLHGDGVLKSVMEVFGRANGTMRPTGYATAALNDKQIEALNNRYVRNPALTLLGLTTADTLFKAVSGDGVVDGFLNRFLIVYSDIGMQESRDSVSRASVPRIVIDWAKEQRDAIVNRPGKNMTDGVATIAPEPIELPITPRARRLFREFEAQNIRRAEELKREGLAEIMVRCTEIAKRLSVIVARSLQQDQITEEAAAWCVEYVKTHTERNLNQLRNHLAESPFHALCKDVYRLIERSGSKGISQREISQRSRKFAAEKPSMKDEVLKNVLRIYPVSQKDRNGTSGRGRKVEVFILNKHIKKA